jgi:hypothetical protein
MRGWIIIGCAALAASCASKKSTDEPAQYAETETTAPSQPETTASPNERETMVPASRQPGAPGEEHAAQTGTENPGANTGNQGSGPTTTWTTNEPQSTPSQSNDIPTTNRDQSAGTTAPTDQTANRSDASITKEVRKAVMADNSLSNTAKNVKISTSNGKVTLRGVVKNDDERKTIEDDAKEVAGEANVENLLQVKK